MNPSLILLSILRQDEASTVASPSGQILSSHPSCGTRPSFGPQLVIPQAYYATHDSDTTCTTECVLFLYCFSATFVLFGSAT